MHARYLCGPVSAAFADQNLHGPRQSGECLTFNATGDADLVVRPGDTWDDVCARLPDGWRPDFGVLYLAYTTIPDGLWSAPVPLVGLAADWNLQFHHFRSLQRCDLLLTDTPGVEALTRAGLRHVRAANLFGLERAFLDEAPAEAPRDIDVLFCGNLHAAVQRRRLASLGRLARLGDRHRVVIATGVFGEDYRRLLRRARIVFNQSIRGECNRRAFEATACGALLFQEAANQEIAAYFEDRRECVLYRDDDLETLLDHYLSHEDERAALAAAEQERVRQYGFEALWHHALERVEAEWPALMERAANRPAPSAEEQLLARTWQALSRSEGGDLALIGDLGAALAGRSGTAALHHALGIAVTLAGGKGEHVAPCFEAALRLDPGHAVAALNLAEVWLDTGPAGRAVEQARRALALLERTGAAPTWLDAAPYPRGFDLLRVEWERAAWAHAGRPVAEAEAKRDLLRWRLHSLLASLTGELTHYHEAALARPDLPVSRAALGCALARAGRQVAAAPHLRQAVADNPFDLAAARALFQVQGDVGDAEAQRRLARDRRLLRQAAPQVVPAESWFGEAAPAGGELASLVILCCNEVDYTRLCLDSVLRHTRRPYEVVLVDNGSTDATPALLDAVRSQAGPERVVVLRNEHNVGFPAGCNQGLAQARGRSVVFLNNDTLVTEGWLEGLIACALRDGAPVGLVGAVTNYSRPPQQIATEYTALDGLAAFAARRRREWAGQALEVERLTGFCLLARRELLDAVGGFDEGFGLGFFDDDDLSVRARRAGFRLLVAQDVFVHHFGSRTFTGLGVDCRQQLADNFERFRAKWGPEHSAGYSAPPAAALVPPWAGHLCPAGRAEMPGPRARTEQPQENQPSADQPMEVVVSEPQPPRPETLLAQQPLPSGGRVSLCMIVKNEEDNLSACLASAAGLFHEVNVVDTGSTDRTREIARQWGARVFDFAWVDSFAAARNESLRHATGDWAFWLDADDRLDEPNRAKLRDLLAGLRDENAAFVLKCLCLPEGGVGSGMVVDHVRLFRNRPDVHWKYRVHEQILPAVRASGGTVRWSDVVIHHTGYQDPALRGRKLERDLRLLRLEDEEHPGDPFTLFNLGSVYQELGRQGEAIPLLRGSLERSHPSDSIVRKLYALIVQCHRQLEQHGEALATCQEGRRHYPEDTELLFVESLVRQQQGDRAGAKALLRQLVNQRPNGEHFASVDAGLGGFKGRNNLAVLCQQDGEHAEAEAQWRAAVAEQPRFTPAWLGLGELCVAQGRWVELEEVARRLEAEAQAPTEAAVLRARGHLAREEFASARGLLEEAIAASPRAVWPRVVLTHVLLREGRDWAAAERALREVLALVPEHVEARRNLAVLLQGQGHQAG